MRNNDPLHDDAQAMALVKKFRLTIGHCGSLYVVEWWGSGTESPEVWAENNDLNRAIVECVAKIPQK